MKSTVIKAIILLAGIISLSSCGTGTTIVFDKNGIRVVPPAESFIIPGTEVEPTK